MSETGGLTMDDHEPQLQVQIPHFVYSSAPTLVPGGGAEVVPLTNPDWFANNGFTPTFVESNPFFAPQEEHQQQQQSNSAPFDFSLSSSVPFSPPPPRQPAPDLSHLLADPTNGLAGPLPFGLPLYSTSGFDVAALLARIERRPNPRVFVGPVDFSCSFTIVDVRRFDNPIVYCSPTFCTLTGYTEAEILGRNCRFLQAPGGQVTRGQPREFTSQGAVAHLRKSLMADKECQTSILNYKKNGAAFYNLLTVIPVPGGLNGEDNDIVYQVGFQVDCDELNANDFIPQVGFQVDLTEQPHAILEKLRDGSYIVNYAAHSDISTLGLPGRPLNRSIPPVSQPQNTQPPNARDRKANAIPPIFMSKEFKRVLAGPAFLQSFPIPTAGPAPSTNAASAEDAVLAGGNNHLLHLFLLEATPHFIHVVSLKGSFLYVAPSVRRVLGYESEEMIGTSISDYAHPEDVIPLMRELKESSATGVGSVSLGETTSSVVPGMPRSVDLLFRARTKMGRYVWVQCRGRLHVEPGKGRKAIILSGKASEMMNLKGDDVNHAGGLAKGLRVLRPDAEKKPVWTEVEQEAWGYLDGTSSATAGFLSVGHGIQDVLGWTPDDLQSRSIMDIVPDQGVRNVIGGFIQAMRTYQTRNQLQPNQIRGLDPARMKSVRCNLRKKDGGLADVWFVIYRADPDEGQDEGRPNDKRRLGDCIAPAALVYQIRLVEAETITCGLDLGMLPTLPMSSSTSSSGSGSTASSSLAGAVPLSLASAAGSSSSSSNQQQQSPATPTATPLWPFVDMFDELAIARRSSWQYEQQQLRIANARLMEECAGYEAAEAAAGLVGVDAFQNQTQAQRGQTDKDKERRTSAVLGQHQPLRPASPMQAISTTTTGYDGYDTAEFESPLAFGDAQIRHQHQHQHQGLFSTQHLLSQLYPSQQQQPFDPLPTSSPLVHPHTLSHPHTHSHQPESYLYQPQPQFSLQMPNLTQGLQHGTSAAAATMPRSGQQRALHPRLSLPSLSQKEWGTMAPLPLPPPPPTGYGQGYSEGSRPSLKRSWNAVDSA